MGRNAVLRPKKDEARGRWYISIPPRLSTTGKRQKRFFKSKEEASTEAHIIKVRRENHGIAAKLLSPAQEQQAVSAFKLLSDAGCEAQLTYVVADYLGRVRQIKLSKTLAHAWDAYIKRSDRTTSKAHNHNLLASKKRFAPLLSKTVAEITPEDIEGCLEGSAATYRNALLREIRAILNWCMGGPRKWLKENPANECEFAAARKATEVEIYSTGEIKTLLNATSLKHSDLVPAVAIMIFAGVRPDHKDGEIIKLKWRHVLIDDTGHERIELPATITKTSKQRSVKIRPALLSWIRWHVDRQGKTSGLVCPYKGQPLRSKIREIFEATHVTRIQDGFRHTFASYLAAVEGMDVVEQELGHQGGRELLNKHYRTDVRRAVADKFWQISPPNTLQTAND
jgi:integrase